MPIIQMPGGNNPLIGAGAAAAAFDDRTRGLRERKFRQEERAQVAQQRRALTEIELAHRAQQEYARRAQQDREYELDVMREQGRDRRFWQGKAVGAGISPEISGANIIQMGARLEELDPARYQEFLAWARDAHGIDFGEGEGQVMPTPELMESLPGAPAMFARLTQALIPLEDANDEERIGEAFTGALESVGSMDPQWLETQEGQRWARDLESSLLREDMTPVEAQRRRNLAESDAMQRVGLKRDRTRYSQKIEDLVAEHKLGDPLDDDAASQLRRIREIQARIYNSRTPRESYIRALAIADPDVNLASRMAHEDGMRQGQAARAVQSEQAAQAAAQPLPEGELPGATRTPSRADITGEPTRMTIDPELMPGAAAVNGGGSESKIGRLRKGLQSAGIDIKDKPAVRAYLEREARAGNMEAAEALGWHVHQVGEDGDV